MFIVVFGGRAVAFGSASRGVLGLGRGWMASRRTLFNDCEIPWDDRRYQTSALVVFGHRACDNRFNLRFVWQAVSYALPVLRVNDLETCW